MPNSSSNPGPTESSGALTPADIQLLSAVGEQVLIAADVASVTADWLAQIHVEVDRISPVFKRCGREIRFGKYYFKLIEADPDTPTNFAILVRRVPSR